MLAALAVDRHRQVVGGAQARVRLERLLGARHVEAVDRLEAVAVLHAEHAEQRVVRTPKRRMPTTLPFSCSGTMRACRMSSAWFSRILSTTPRSMLNSVGADALDALLDVVGHGARRRPRGHGGGRRRGGGVVDGGGRRLEQLRLAELAAARQPHAVPADELHVLAAERRRRAGAARSSLRPGASQRRERPVRIGRRGDDEHLHAVARRARSSDRSGRAAAAARRLADAACARR